MSKARLVITAVLVEGRSQSQVARDYGVSQSWISRLITRYTAEGEAAFEPRSRRPHSSPTPAAPKPTQQHASTPTTASAPTAPTKPEPSPCASTDACTTSASAATTTEPASEILAQDHHITVINAATGEVLRDFTLDPTRDYQPTGAPKGPKGPKRKKPRT